MIITTTSERITKFSNYEITDLVTTNIARSEQSDIQIFSNSVILDNEL